MTLKEVLETKVIGLIPIGECNCGCGEEMYDLITNNNLAYQPLSKKIIKQVRPDLLGAWQYERTNTTRITTQARHDNG